MMSLLAKSEKLPKTTPEAWPKSTFDHGRPRTRDKCPTTSSIVCLLTAEKRTWRQTLNSPSNEVFVAEVEQEIVAFSSFGPVRDEGLDKNSVGEVYAIYALEEFWDRGFGRRLMEASLATLSEMNCSTVKVWVLDTNQRAISFYQKFGFTAEGVQKVEARGGVELREIRYSLSMV